MADGAGSHSAPYPGQGPRQLAAPVCCGLTWISTGQLAIGKKILEKTVAALAPHVAYASIVPAICSAGGA
jgi:hypothetical protein